LSTFSTTTAESRMVVRFTQFLSLEISITHRPILQGSVATCCRYDDWKCTGQSTMKEFRKSVKIWYSYRHRVQSLPFWNTEYLRKW